MFRFGENAEQFDVVWAEHDGVIARSHLGAMRASRRKRESKPLPVLGSFIQVVDDDNRMVNSDDVL
jgi:hypothetical protein